MGVFKSRFHLGHLISFISQLELANLNNTGLFVDDCLKYKKVLAVKIH